MKKDILTCENAPKAIGPYSQGVSVSSDSKLFYFSGQLGINPATGKIEGDVTEQTTMALSNISELLKSNGLTAKNVIKTLVFLTEMGNFPLVNAEYSKFFSSECPARSCVAVSALPLGGLVEIEIIAAN